MESIQGQEIVFLIGAGVLIMLGMALALIAFYGHSQRKLLSQKLEAQDRILQETIMAQEEERRFDDKAGKCMQSIELGFVERQNHAGHGLSRQLNNR